VSVGISLCVDGIAGLGLSVPRGK